MTSAKRLPPGASRFEFEDTAGRSLRVYVYRPAEIEKTTPVLFVLHGVERDAERYLADWRRLAATRNVILVVPEFSNRLFPGAAAYNQGNTFDRSSGTLNPPELWSFSVIEPLFDAVRERAGTRVDQYSMFGHSAGAQFVHRYALLRPDARVDTVVAANAGWYTLPEPTELFPYGLDGTGATQQRLKSALGHRLILLLGTADIDADTAHLKSSRRVKAQGRNRFARGHMFFEAAQSAARETGAQLAWTLAYAPGIAHDNAGIAPYAMRLLYPDSSARRNIQLAGLTLGLKPKSSACSDLAVNPEICEASGLAVSADPGVSLQLRKSGRAFDIGLPGCRSEAPAGPTLRAALVDAASLRERGTALRDRTGSLADDGAALILVTGSRHAGRIERRGSGFVIHISGRSSPSGLDLPGVKREMTLSLRVRLARRASDGTLAARLYPVRSSKDGKLDYPGFSDRDLSYFANAATHIRQQTIASLDFDSGRDEFGPYLETVLDSPCTDA